MDEIMKLKIAVPSKGRISDPAVNILENWGVIAPNLVPIVVVMVVSTFIVFIVSGVITQLLLRKGDKHNA